MDDGYDFGAAVKEAMKEGLWIKELDHL
jgi:hypothetical protein